MLIFKMKKKRRHKPNERNRKLSSARKSLIKLQIVMYKTAVTFLTAALHTKNSKYQKKCNVTQHCIDPYEMKYCVISPLLTRLNSAL